MADRVRRRRPTKGDVSVADAEFYADLEKYMDSVARLGYDPKRARVASEKEDEPLGNYGGAYFPPTDSVDPRARGLYSKSGDENFLKGGDLVWLNTDIPMTMNDPDLQK